MRARFIGVDGSCGYRTGWTYDLVVETAWLARNVRILRPRPVPYESWQAFWRNWTPADTEPLGPPSPAPERVHAAHEQTRRALEQCWHALTFSYGGTARDAYFEPEDLAAYDAMTAAGRALGKPHCGATPPPAVS